MSEFVIRFASYSENFAQRATELAEQMREAAEIAATLARDAVDKTTAKPAELVADASAVSGVDPFIFQISIFVLAIFVGYHVVWSVTPALHTPLMAVTNAISSVIVVGALLGVGIGVAGGMATGFGFIALVLAAVNIFGGFLVTQRMLAMYKKKER